MNVQIKIFRTKLKITLTLIFKEKNKQYSKREIDE